MTEVPEHLLQRSRERREALGLAPSGGAPAEATSPAEVPAAEAPAAEAGPAPVEATTPAPPAPAATAEAPEPQPEPAPTYVAPTVPRSGVPVWMLPVLAILPIWAVVYAGAFGESKKVLTPLELGQQIYAGKGTCAGCHGAQGQGGTGPALAGGEAKVTFPNEADHVAWIENGSAPSRGQPYGDPNRPGGPRVAEQGVMPAFKGQLSDAEIKAVVLYEREGLQ